MVQPKTLRLFRQKDRTARVLSYYRTLNYAEKKGKDRITDFFKVGRENGIKFRNLDENILSLLIAGTGESQIINLLKSSNSSLNLYELLDMSSLMISFGYFNAALWITEKALKTALSYKRNIATRTIFTEIILTAALELQDEELIKKALKRTNKFSSFSFVNPYYRTLYERFVENKTKGYFNADPQFLSLIKGKTIAIVGPLNLSSEQQSELGGYDLRATMNIADFTGKRYSTLKPHIIYNDNSITKKLILKPLVGSVLNM